MRTQTVGRRTTVGASLLAVILAVTAAAWPAVAQGETGTLEIESIGGLYPDVTAVCGGPATDSAPEGEAIEVRFEGANLAEVPAGTCDVTWTEPSGESNGVRVGIEAGVTTLVRGALIAIPWATGERMLITDRADVAIWDASTDAHHRIWVLPG